MLSVEMMREMSMKACYAGWVHAPASVFFCFRQCRCRLSLSLFFLPFSSFFCLFFFSVFFSRCSLFCFPFPFFHSNERIKKKINSLCSLRFLFTPSVLFFSFFCSLFSFSYCLPLLLFFLLLFRSVEEAYI